MAAMKSIEMPFGQTAELYSLMSQGLSIAINDEIPNLVGASGIEIAAVEYIKGALLEWHGVGGARHVVPHIHIPGRAAGSFQFRADTDEGIRIGRSA